MCAEKFEKTKKIKKSNSEIFSENKKRIGIFGGSFDPVHRDHVSVCESFYKAAHLDRLLIIPAGVSPFKNECFASGADRIEMLKLAFCDFCGNVKISDEEIARGGKSYTYETVANIADRSEYKNAELYFLIGEDSALTFHTWKNPQEILKHAHIAIVGRGNGNLCETIKFFKNKNSAYLTREPLAINACGGAASTLVREYLKLGVSPFQFVPDKVCEYIERRGLYLIDDKYYDFMRKNSKPERLKHTAGVVFFAREYAKRLSVSEQKAALAALLHDAAKYLDYRDYQGFDINAIAAEFGEKNVPKPVIHQFLGEYVARTVLGVTDEEVLSAIRYHTTGRPRMTNLEKIIFVADLLEPSRGYADVNELRAAVDADFESGFLLCVERIYAFLKKDGEQLFLTEAVHDYYAKNNRND